MRKCREGALAPSDPPPLDQAMKFARDAKILVDAGWRLGEVACIDQFRFSPHVELVAAFSREGRRATKKRSLLS